MPVALAQTPSERVLVFSKTATFRHKSIPAGQQALLKPGQENGFPVDTTESSSNFTGDNLKRYKAIIFLSTTGDVLNEAQQATFKKYIQAGAALLVFMPHRIRNTTGRGMVS